MENQYVPTLSISENKKTYFTRLYTLIYDTYTNHHTIETEQLFKQDNDIFTNEYDPSHECYMFGSGKLDMENNYQKLKLLGHIRCQLCSYDFKTTRTFLLHSKVISYEIDVSHIPEDWNVCLFSNMMCQQSQITMPTFTTKRKTKKLCYPPPCFKNELIFQKSNRTSFMYSYIETSPYNVLDRHGIVFSYEIISQNLYGPSKYIDTLYPFMVNIIHVVEKKNTVVYIILKQDDKCYMKKLHISFSKIHDTSYTVFSIPHCIGFSLEPNESHNVSSSSHVDINHVDIQNEETSDLCPMSKKLTIHETNILVPTTTISSFSIDDYNNVLSDYINPYNTVIEGKTPIIIDGTLFQKTQKVPLSEQCCCNIS